MDRQDERDIGESRIMVQQFAILALLYIFRDHDVHIY